MKAAAVTNYVLFGVVCVSVLFVSMAVAATEVAHQDKPMEADGKIEGELASGRCIRGCCNRNFFGKCKVCCASAEEAKAAAAVVRGGFRLAHGGGQAAGEHEEAKEAEP